jgi:hypothetical protein
MDCVDCIAMNEGRYIYVEDERVYVRGCTKVADAW